MKMKLVFLIALSCVVASCAPMASAGSLDDYHASLDRTCLSDADCQVMNVGNCCGYYPGCLNKNAKPDAAQIQKLCAKDDMASVCGFQDIAGCACVDGQCQPSGADSIPATR